MFVAQWLAISKPAAAFYLLPTRGWELLIGALAAFYDPKSNQKFFGKGLSEIFGYFGISLIFFSVFSYSNKIPFPSIYTLVPTVGAMLVIVFGTQQTTIGKLIGNKIFVGIGLISYSAYLWHQPIFSLFKQSDIKESKLVQFLLLIFALILAYFSWLYIERPFRERKRFSRNQIFSFVILIMVFFIVFGVSGYKSNGFENRDKMAIFKDLKYNTSVLGYAKCESDLIDNVPKIGYCYGSNNVPTALVIGDSHADDKFYGIEKFIKGYNWRLIGNPSCPPLYGVRFKSADGMICTEKLNKIFSYINSQKSIRLVILSFAHAYPLDTLIAADHIQRKFDQNNSIIEDIYNPTFGKIEAFYAGLKRTVDYLEARKIKTIILLDVPELTFFPLDCLKGKIGCEFNRNAVIKRQEILRKYISKLSHDYSDLLVFDPLDIFCSGDSCQILNNSRPLYRDSHHLTLYGSLIYGKTFSEWYLNYTR